MKDVDADAEIAEVTTTMVEVSVVETAAVYG